MNQLDFWNVDNVESRWFLNFKLGVINQEGYQYMRQGAFFNISFELQHINPSNLANRQI